MRRREELPRPKREGKRERRKIEVSWFTHTLHLKSTLQGASGWRSSPLAAHNSSGGTSRTEERSENASLYGAPRLSHSKETLSSTKERSRSVTEWTWHKRRTHGGMACHSPGRHAIRLGKSDAACVHPDASRVCKMYKKSMRDHDRKRSALPRVRSASIYRKTLIAHLLFPRFRRKVHEKEKRPASESGRYNAALNPCRASAQC